MKQYQSLDDAIEHVKEYAEKLLKIDSDWEPLDLVYYSVHSLRAPWQNEGAALRALVDVMSPGCGRCTPEEDKAECRKLLNHAKVADLAPDEQPEIESIFSALTCLGRMGFSQARIEAYLQHPPGFELLLTAYQERVVQAAQELPSPNRLDANT